MDISMRRCANVLALVATLALALVPTLGRGWMAAHAPAAAHGEHGAHRAHRQTHGAHASPDTRGERDAPMGLDCDYCAIAAGMALADVPAAPSATHARHAAARPAANEPARAIAPRGLGARGPPDIG